MNICVNLTDEDRRNLTEIYSNRSVVAFYLACCLLSLVMSLINLIVLTRPRMLRSSLNLMLVALESAYFFLSLLPIPIFIVRISADYVYRTEYEIMYRVLLPAIWADVSFIVWMTVVISIWRYLAISHPLRCREWLRRSRAMAVVIVLILFCVILTGVQFLGFQFEFKYPPKNCSLQVMPEFYEHVWGSRSTKERLLWADFYVALNLLTYLVPVACFLVTHSLIARKLWLRRNVVESLQEGIAQRETHDTRSTVILVILLFTFIAAHAPTCLLVGIELGLSDYKGVPLPWEETMWEFIPGLVVNAGSFVGYYYMNPMFRETYCQVVRKMSVFRTQTSRPSLVTTV